MLSDDDRKLVVSGGDVTPDFLQGLESKPELKHLTIWGGPLTNVDLEPLSRLVHLKGLCLGEMRIDDGIFRHLEPLRGLEHLNLAYTNVRGDFRPLTGAPLRDVRMEGCRHVGDSCANTLAEFPSLRQVEIHMTGLSDAGVRSLSALPLETLWLGPRITDEGMRAIGNIPTLKHLDLCAHMVTDEGAPALSKLTAVETLWLTRCTLTDESVPVLCGLNTLKELNVSFTGISEAGLGRIRSALPNTRLIDPD